MQNSYEMGGCVACGGSDSATLASGDELRSEMEDLWRFHVRRLRPGTPPEMLADRTVFSQKRPLRLARCGSCGLIFRNPRERERVLVDTYAEEALDQAALLSLFGTQRDSYRAQAARLTRLAGRAGTGLEVGSYVGAFLAAAAECGWSFEGVDVNAAAVAFAREQGFQVREGVLAEEVERQFDAVTIWNTFEQLPDPRATASTALRLLRPGGILAVRVPNGRFYAALRERTRGLFRAPALALLAHNNLLGFPYRHGFSPDNLRTLLERIGFRVVHYQGDALVPIADEWTRKWAGMEERLLKGALRAVAPVLPAPWFEMYATPRDEI